MQDFIVWLKCFKAETTKTEKSHGRNGWNQNGQTESAQTNTAQKATAQTKRLRPNQPGRKVLFRVSRQVYFCLVKLWGTCVLIHQNWKWWCALCKENYYVRIWIKKFWKGRSRIILKARNWSWSWRFYLQLHNPGCRSRCYSTNLLPVP